VKDWNTLRQVACQDYSDGIVGLATIEIVECSNRPSVIGPPNDAEAGRAATIMRDAFSFMERASHNQDKRARSSNCLGSGQCL